jgi:hypothetical protein
MRLVTLFLIAAFAASTVDAASYQKTGGTIVDPMLDRYGEPHIYNGANLEPHANLRDADLSDANLYHANLWGADLWGANLWGANLWGANLSYADLSYADLSGADLTGVRRENTNLTDAYYYTDNIPTWNSGMDQAWRDSEGILAIEPTSGDINSDGVFDAADYTVWQDNGGDPIDYRTWKDYFGQSIASGSGADHVPEPTTLLLALLALVAVPL